MGLLRRTFLLGSAALAGGVAFGWYRYRTPHPNPLADRLGPGEYTFNPFVRIGADGAVTVIVPRAEMGQGVTTTLAALVGEEMDQPVASLRVEHGPASNAYFNAALFESAVPFAPFDRGVVATIARDAVGVAGKFLGLQITGGSSSTIDAFDRMRYAGAAARAVLVEVAARRLGRPVSALEFETGAVIDPGSGKRLPFAELSGEAAEIEPSRDVQLKPPAQWRWLGRSQPRLDVPAKTRGEARFGIDVRLPQMLHAALRRSPYLGGGMRRFDPAPALAMAGVVEVVDVGDGVAVVAEDTWLAFEAARVVEIEWEPPETPRDTEAIFAVIDAALATDDGDVHRDDGDVDSALAGAVVIEARYRVPYLAHTCMEPMNATARVADGRCEVWVGTQGPTGVRDDVAMMLGLEPDRVEVHTTLMGGGFGRRGEPDAAHYAAKVAAALPGRTVKTTWSREEDTTHDAYRPGAAARFRGAVNASGVPVALDAHIAAQSVARSTFSRLSPPREPIGADALIVEGCHNQPYSIEHYRVTGHEVPLDYPVGYWRSVGNSYNGFFHESFLDELAVAAGADPVAMRLALTERWPFVQQVIRRAAELARWSEPLVRPRGRGFAFTMSFGAYVAQVVEVTDGPDGISVDRVVAVADCGLALDPRNVEGQIEGGIVYGLSAAMMQSIDFEADAVRQSNFHDHDALRIHQAPAITVEILQNAPAMGGAGEPGTPPSLPALGNAIFAATGRRLRELPFSNQVRFAG